MNTTGDSFPSPTFHKFKKNHISSLGEVSCEDANQFMNEIRIFSAKINYNRAIPFVKDYLEKGIDLLKSTIRWD